MLRSGESVAAHTVQLANRFKAAFFSRLSECGESVSLAYDSWTIWERYFVVAAITASSTTIISVSRDDDLENRRQTTSNIERKLEEIILEFKKAGIVVSCCVADNAKNMQSANTSLPCFSARCVAHTIQLMVKELLTHLHEEIEFSAQMVCFAEEKGLSPKKRNDTRWNSILHEMRWIIKSKDDLDFAQNCSSFGKRS